MSGSITPAHVYRPSNARLIVLDGFVPVPRGAVATPPVMPSWPIKDPGDVLDYTLDISAAVSGDDGDAVSNISVVITPDADPTLTLTSAAMDGTLVVLWLGGGAAGTIYSIALTLILSSGRILARSISLPVYSLAGTTAPTAILTTNTGDALTDGGGNPIVVAG